MSHEIHHYMYCPAIREESSDAHCTCWEYRQRLPGSRMELEIADYQALVESREQLADRDRRIASLQDELGLAECRTSDAMDERDQLASLVNALREALTRISYRATHARSADGGPWDGQWSWDRAQWAADIADDALALPDHSADEWLREHDAKVVEPWRAAVELFFRAEDWGDPSAVEHDAKTRLRALLGEPEA